MDVAAVMTRDVVTVCRADSFKDAVVRMVDAQVNGLPVLDDERAVVGIVTEADLVTKEAFEPGRQRPFTSFADVLANRSFYWIRKAKGLTVGDVMTAKVHTASSSEDVRDAARRMLEHGVKCLPVVDDGRLVGIVARRDILRVFLRSDEELQADIEEILRNPLRYPTVSRMECAVWDGQVLLEGEVEHRRDVDVIGALVSRTPGVVKVHNNLRVRPRGALVLEDPEQEVRL
jgi:CBS-domain-containing membrane protein